MPDIIGGTDASCDGPPGTCSPCGNGMLNPPAETCDDGNRTGGDGCSPDCKTETDWICPTPGRACVYTVACGDGMVAGAETCDDKNTKAGDGCDARCQLEPGWTCPQAGARCVPRCGDGTKLGLRAVRRRQHVAGRRLQRRLPGRAGLRLPDAGPGLPPDDVRRQREGRQRGLRRRKHLRRRRLRRRLPRRTGLHGNERLHVALWRRAEAAERSVRRRKRRLRRRLLGHLHARAQLGLPRRERRRRRQPGRAGHLPRLHAARRPERPSQLRRGRLRHDRDRHGPGDARGRPQAGDGRRAAAERIVDHGGRLRRVVPRLAAEQGRARHDDADAPGERHVRLRSFGEVERHGAGRMDHAAVLPGRRSRMGRAAERPGDEPPRRLRRRPREAQLQLHQRGALLVRVRRRRDAGVHRRRRRLGLRQRPAGGRSRRHPQRIVGQRHARRRGRDAVRADGRPHLRDRRVPGGAPHLRLVVQAHPRLVRAQDDDLHAPLRGRDRQRPGDLRRRRQRRPLRRVQAGMRQPRPLLRRRR